MQMPNLIKKNLKKHSTNFQNSTQIARKTAQNPEFSKQVETEMKTESTKISWKKLEKSKYFGKVRFTAYFGKSQHRKNEKSESSPPI